ncbi:MAG: carboxypeptidase-like regulatory domain-containing protein [Bacteroidales bacterium]|nr:carboxypeptidase-like regulatory domain-containing protein [Bacteroidales bacterium]
MKKTVLIILTLFSAYTLYSQKLSGWVYEAHTDHERHGIYGAYVYWAGTSTGTTTDHEGRFTLPKNGQSDMLVISFTGFQNDTLLVEPTDHSIDIKMEKNHALKTFTILEKRSSTFLSKMDPIATEHITGAELHKAACCNLGESFETNASVDVSYGDAVSGSKKIELLGLAGVYSQILVENMADLRGYGRTFGLSYIPGHWLESISVSKGTSTVLNGYESITGQINVELKKPDDKERFYLNLYGNDWGKFESNANVSFKLNDAWSTMILYHGGINNNRLDRNSDNFLDIPLTQNIHLMNRWKYHNKNNSMITQFGFSLLDESRLGGHIDYQQNNSGENTAPFGFVANTKRYSAFLKGGYVFSKRKNTSVGLINHISWHNQSVDIESADANPTLIFQPNFHVEQLSLYHSYVFDTYLFTTDHQFQVGLSYKRDQIMQELADTVAHDFHEDALGAALQYTYTHNNITLMAGGRVDKNNRFGTLFIPRLHLRFKPLEHTTMRMSGGKGYRSPLPYAEHFSLHLQSREIIGAFSDILEEAWNYGVHLSQEFTINHTPATINAEVFRTDFVNQMVINYEADADAIIIENLAGKSYANNMQVDFRFEPFTRFDVLLAVRYTDVKTTINNELVMKPFSKRYKALVNLSYATKLNKWQFDVTAQLNGKSRLPDDSYLPERYRGLSESPAYTIVNTQLTKRFRLWDIYAGVENLTDFTQKNPIIAADDPLNGLFDASRIWGPVIGRKIYAGMRLTINRQE